MGTLINVCNYKNAVGKPEQKYLEKIELERAETYFHGTVYWVETQDRGCDSHSLFPSLTLNHIIRVIYLCLLSVRDEKTLILT